MKLHEVSSKSDDSSYSSMYFYYHWSHLLNCIFSEWTHFSLSHLSSLFMTHFRVQSSLPIHLSHTPFALPSPLQSITLTHLCFLISSSSSSSPFHNDLTSTHKHTLTHTWKHHVTQLIQSSSLELSSSPTATIYDAAFSPEAILLYCDIWITVH